MLEERQSPTLGLLIIIIIVIPSLRASRDQPQ
jgi:hypothetical protein